MRIISGKFKGHKLNIPKNFLIRPTTDRFKESLFSIINSDKYSSNIVGKYFRNKFCFNFLFENI